MTRPLSPECRLVFRTADPACATAEVAMLAAEVADWERVLILAERELATAPIARALAAAGDVVPREDFELFRRNGLTTELRMQFLSRRLQQTCGLLVERGISCLLLKGAALGAMIDPTFCWRPMLDVDILIGRDDVARAGDAITASGWVPTQDQVLTGLLANAHHQPPFFDPMMPGIRVELHVSLLPARQPFTFDESDLWRDARAAPAPFTGTLVPSPEHLLLHAAMHFAWQHRMQFGAWRTFRLAAAVSRGPDFDWDRFVAAALQARAASSSYWTLRMAATMAGIVAPPDVLQRLAPPTSERVLSALERHFIAAIAVGETPESPSVWLSRRLWIAAMRSRSGKQEQSGNWDIENRWGKAFGTASTETVRQRVRRHVVDYRRWLSFVTETLFG